MDEEFAQGFHGMQDLGQYCQYGGFEDIPLSNEVLDGFCLGSYQVPAPGRLPSPNSSNPDLLASGRQSSLSPSLSQYTSGFEIQPIDGSSNAHNDFLDLQGSSTIAGLNTSNSNSNTNQRFSDAVSSSSEAHGLQGEPSVTSSSGTNVTQCQSFMVPSDGSLCVSYQSRASSVPSEISVEKSVTNWSPNSTHVVNNTSSASAPANTQHSPTSKALHFVRHPSHLRYQIHPELPQHSPSTAIATGQYTTSQPSHTMSPTSKFTDRQEPNASPSHRNFQNVSHPPHRPQFRRITSGHNQSRGSPALHNHQPFQENSLRLPVTSNSGQGVWEAGNFQVHEYPDPQPIVHQQSNHSPYLGHHYVSQPQEDFMNSYCSARYLMQSSDSRNASSISQGSINFDLNGSSPMTMKRELSPPGSDHSLSTLISRSQIASPKPQKKRRTKQELKDNEDNEAAIDPAALQTADLTNLDPTDQTNVAALIDAMHNTDNVEDNQGMQKTWEKIRRAKALRIKEVCVELLDLTKQAQRKKGTPLGDKRPINHYSSFQTRFDALRETLMYQKTVCKHLIEPPYSYSVVDDPQNARDRVKNNRRVNHQKAEAIRLGREHLGEKGQGKGKPMLKTKKRVQAQLEETEDDEENSGDDALSDAETDVLPRVLGPKSGRLASRAPKRTKRSSDSTQLQEHGGDIQVSYSPQSQSWEDPLDQNLRQSIQPVNQRWDHVLSRLVANQKMPTLNQSYDFQSPDRFGSSFYGDNSAAGSDSEGFGARGWE